MTRATEPFAAVLEPDPGHLRSLRVGLAQWLEAAGVDGTARDDVVVAAHEAAASAMASPGDVLVDASIEGDVVAVVVASDDGWRGPDEDVEGQRVRLLREVVSAMSFQTLSGRSSLRLEKTLAA